MQALSQQTDLFSALRPLLTQAVEGNHEARGAALQLLAKHQWTARLHRYGLTPEEIDDLLGKLYCIALTRPLLTTQPEYFAAFYWKRLKWLTCDYLKSPTRQRMYSLDSGTGGEDSYDLGNDPRLASDSHNPATLVEQNDLHTRLHALIATLKPEWERVVRLHYFEELSLKEIESKTGVPENRLKSHLFHARKTLQKRLLAA